MYQRWRLCCYEIATLVHHFQVCLRGISWNSCFSEPDLEFRSIKQQRLNFMKSLSYGVCAEIERRRVKQFVDFYRLPTTIFSYKVGRSPSRAHFAVSLFYCLSFLGYEVWNPLQPDPQNSRKTKTMADISKIECNCRLQSKNLHFFEKWKNTPT